MARKDKEEKGNEAGAITAIPRSRIRERIKTEIGPKMQEQFGYKSTMQIPKLEKIVINMGTGTGEKDPKNLENSVRDMTLIAGQKPVVTVAKKAISNFKVREGMKVGCKVTLRGDRMYHFFDRLANVVLPRIRDFQGLSPKSSTAAATTPSASKSNSSSPRSLTTRSTGFEAWTSSSARPPRTTKKPVSSSSP
jgi:Ribosomal protein L5